MGGEEGYRPSVRILHALHNRRVPLRRRLHLVESSEFSVQCSG